MFDTIRNHWTTIATVLGVWAAIATVLVRVPSLTPDVMSAGWKRALHTFLIDWPAALPKVDFRGLFGLPVNVPYLTVSRTDGAGDQAILKVALVGFIAVGLVACACWEPTNPKFSTPQCVVARATVQCGSSAAVNALGQLLVNAPQQQWEQMLADLKGDASPAIGCLFAGLPTALANARRKLGLTDGQLASHLLTVARADGEFVDWKHRHGYEHVSFCFTNDAGQVCR